MIRFRNIDFYPNEEFGLRDISFTVNEGERLELVVSHEDQRTGIAGLLTGRFHPQAGRIYREEENHSVGYDADLLGGKVITEGVSRYWRLCKPEFEFQGRTKQKFVYIDLLRAKGLVSFTVNRLRGEERLKFALLALLFQTHGLLLLQDLPKKDLTPPMWELLQLLHQHAAPPIVYLRLESETMPHLAGLANVKPIRQVVLTGPHKTPFHLEEATSLNPFGEPSTGN